LQQSLTNCGIQYISVGEVGIGGCRRGTIPLCRNYFTFHILKFALVLLHLASGGNMMASKLSNFTVQSRLLKTPCANKVLAPASYLTAKHNLLVRLNLMKGTPLLSLAAMPGDKLHHRLENYKVKSAVKPARKFN